jgi:hypothetical protein
MRMPKDAIAKLQTAKLTLLAEEHFTEADRRAATGLAYRLNAAKAVKRGDELAARRFLNLASTADHAADLLVETGERKLMRAAR